MRSCGMPRLCLMLALALVALVATGVEAQSVGDTPWSLVFRIPSPVGDRWLGAMWASGPNDVFAVGRRCIAHFDGRSWSITPDHSVSAIFDVEGSGPRDVYAVGSLETIQRWDGTRWTLEHQAAASGLRGGAVGEVLVAAPGEAYALTRDGALRRRADGAWEATSEEEVERVRARLAPPEPTATPCRSAAQELPSSEAAWVARCGGRVWLWTGGAWRDSHLALVGGRSIDELLVLDADHDLAVLTNGDVLYRAGDAWARELETRLPGRRGRVSVRTLLRVGDRVYLTADHRIYARTIR